MSAFSLGKQVASAFNREKPNSSITQWVEILTSTSYEDEAYDGIPEIVESINLQPTGPAESSRALRKKLKHGNAHSQYRALVILKVLVENCGHKFQTTFADGQLTDAIKHLATDPGTDPKVKRKLLSVLSSWNNQFKSDPSMTLVAGLYKQYRPVERRSHQQSNAEMDQIFAKMSLNEKEVERKRKEKEEREAAKRKAKENKERTRQGKNKSKRVLFDFENEKPQIFTAIANTSQAANNLVNAITLVNTENDSLQTNERVQECLNKAKQCRKPIVRYIQLVENEELIGTLIDTNERIIAALEMYDKLLAPATTAEVDSAVHAGLAAANLSHTESEVTKLQERQRAAVSRAVRSGSYRREEREVDGGEGHLHPDLQDLSFGALGAEQPGLPVPLRPSPLESEEKDAWKRRGSLSDFSDYDDDSDGDDGINGKGRGYVHVSDDDGPAHASSSKSNKLADADDPFADPFAG